MKEFSSSKEKAIYVGQPRREAPTEGEIVENYRILPQQDQLRVAIILDELKNMRQSSTPEKHAENIRVLAEVTHEGGELGLLQDRDMGKRAYKLQKESKKLNQATEMMVVCNDFQFPDCDEEAVGAFLKFVNSNKRKITHFVINGDLADNKMQSKFPKDLEELATRTQREIDTVDWFLHTITKYLPNAEKVWAFGNHDKPRWENLFKNEVNGVKPWLKTIEEMFDLEKRGWKTLEYGQGQAYRWHDRLVWHGTRAGIKSNIGKLEFEDTGVGSTTGHTNRNTFWEVRNALGELFWSIGHAGFSEDNLEFVKKANSGWSLGFGIYYWHPKVGEQPYMVLMKHNSGRFIDPTGVIYSGKGFKLP